MHELISFLFDPTKPEDVAYRDALLAWKAAREAARAPTDAPVPAPPAPQPVPVPVPPVVLPKWETVYVENWEKYPVGVEYPDATVDWTALWSPWTNGSGAWDGTGREKASAKVMPRADGRHVLRGSIHDTVNNPAPIGMRLFLNDHRRWEWWGKQFPEQTARIRQPVKYLKPFTLAGGAGKFFQAWIEFKTLEKLPNGQDKPTAVQILVRQEADGKHYFYMNLGGVEFEPISREPIHFGVPLMHELIIEFSRQDTASVQFTCGNTVVRGTGRTLNPDNGGVGGGLVVYSNEIQIGEEAACEFGDLTIERQTANTP